MNKLIHSQTSTVQPLTFGNGWVILSHTLLGMWLLIHAGRPGKHRVHHGGMVNWLVYKPLGYISEKLWNNHGGIMSEAPVNIMLSSMYAQQQSSRFLTTTRPTLDTLCNCTDHHGLLCDRVSVQDLLEKNLEENYIAQACLLFLIM